MKKIIILICFLSVILCLPVFAMGPYVDNGDGTVSDLGTGLMWQQSDDGKEYTWQEALEYSENLVLAGQNDWRLPNIRELETIVDDTRYNPAINTNYFIDTKSDWYWSGSTYASNSNRAWLVYFYSGYVYYCSKPTAYYVRCVRSGPSGSFDPLVLCTVNGSVVDDVSRSGIPGAGLSFISTGFNKEYQIGNDGSFHITDVPSGTYQVQVSADGYQSESLGNITLAPGLVQTLKVSLEQNRPKITEKFEDTVEIINNAPTPVTVYASVTDPDGIADIASVTLNLSDIGGGLTAQAMSLTDAAAGKFEAVITVPGDTAARLYSIPVTAEDKAGFTDSAKIKLDVARKSVETVASLETATQKVDNPIDRQNLDIFVQAGEGITQRRGGEIGESEGVLAAGGIRAAVEDCYVEVKIYQPDGELYDTYQVYDYLDITIKNAMQGQWTYETINYCAESIDVEIETRGANTGILTGTVRDTDSRQGVEDAAVQWSLGGEAVTDSQGYFSIVAVAGTCALVTSADDYQIRLRTDVSLSSGKTTTLAIELVPDAFEPLPVPETQITEMILNPACKADYLNQPLAAFVQDGNLSVSSCFAPYQEPVNIYLGMTLSDPDFLPYFFLFNTDDQLGLLTDALFPWREMTSDWSEADLFSIPVILLPKGDYSFYLLVTDDPDTLSRYDFRFFTVNVD